MVTVLEAAKSLVASGGNGSAGTNAGSTSASENLVRKCISRLYRSQAQPLPL